MMRRAKLAVLWHGIKKYPVHLMSVSPLVSAVELLRKPE